MGSLKANNLVTLVLDCERATKQNLDPMSSLKVGEPVAPMLERGRVNKKNLDHMGSLKAKRSFGRK